MEHQEKFYDIPGYSKYKITETGKVWSEYQNGFIKGSRNPSGYHNFRIKSDDGYILTWGRHRLLCYVFKNPGRDIKDLVVNHKNFIKGDDFLDNLEWCTYQDNVHHAGGYDSYPKCKRVQLRDSSTGKILDFQSFLECSKYLGISKDSVSWRIRKGKGGRRIYKDGYQYRQKTDKPWSVGSRCTTGRSKPSLAKDLRTGEVHRFYRQKDLGEFLGIKDSTISLILKNYQNQVLPGLFLVKNEENPEDWADVFDPYLDLCKSRFVKPVVKSTVSGDVIEIYDSPKHCGVCNTIFPTALDYHLKRDDKRTYRDGFCYRYYDIFLSVFNKSAGEVIPQ